LRRRNTARGFTIMEVMVSIMILSVSVVSIFGAQFAAVATTEFSKNLTHALNLAKCRMSEIELKVLNENGFQIADTQESGDCCEAIKDDVPDEFTCEWEVKRIELPDIQSLLSEGGADGGLGLLTDLNLGADPSMDDEADEGNILGALSSFMPLISDMLGEGIRRVSVTVKWQQGSSEKEFVLSQFIVHPSQESQDLFNAAMLLGATDESATGADESSGDSKGGSSGSRSSGSNTLFPGGNRSF
jgi:prepilin-type N-terminal cleavage/methylation domain-containing protein